MFLLATQLVNLVEDMVSSDFQTGNSPQTYQRYIRVAKYFHVRSNILHIIENIDGEESGATTLNSSQLNDETFFLS